MPLCDSDQQSCVITSQFTARPESCEFSSSLQRAVRAPRRNLMDAYRELVLPGKSVTSKKQISTHKTAIAQFTEFASQHDDRCTEPIVILNGSKSVLREFAVWLIRRRHLSCCTAMHRVTHVRMVCRAMAESSWIKQMPTSPRHDELQGIQRSTSRPTRKVSKSVSFDDATRLISACSVATYPQLGDTCPCEFWRCMIVWHALYGPRTQDLYAYLESTKTGLIWSDVFFDSECPDPDIAQALPDLRSPFGWIYYPVSKDKKSDCPFVLFPMTAGMAEFVRSMRGISDPAGQNRVFPVARNSRKFGQTWAAIRAAAGVSDTIFLSQGTGGASAFRKTAAKWWKRVTGSDEVSQYVLHHAEVTTAARHYLDTMETVVPLLLKHLGEFPLVIGRGFSV